MKKVLIILIAILAYGCVFDNEDTLFDGVSCQENCLIFEGYVANPNNLMGLESNIKILHNAAWMLADGRRKVGEIKTDEEGYFFFTFEGEEFKEDYGFFEIKAFKTDYLTSDIDGRRIYYEVDSTNFDLPIEANIDLRPRAHLNVKVDVKTLATNFNFSYKYATTDYNIGNGVNNIIRDSTYRITLAGSQYNYIRYSYKIDDDYTSVEDSIFISAFDEVDYSIEIK